MVKLVAEHSQILVDFLRGYLGVLLRGGDVRVSQYPAHALDGHSLTQGKGRESMTSAMEGNLLRDTALLYHLFQRFTD